MYHLVARYKSELTQKYQSAQQIVSQTYSGGIESAFFEYVGNKTIEPKGSKLPVLGGLSPKNLSAAYCGDQFKTTRENWVVQSSAVDFLHIFLVAMDWLTKKYKIDAVFAISVHDQIRFLSTKEDAERYRWKYSTNDVSACFPPFKKNCPCISNCPCYHSIHFFKTVRYIRATSELCLFQLC